MAGLQVLDRFELLDGQGSSVDCFTLDSFFQDQSQLAVTKDSKDNWGLVINKGTVRPFDKLGEVKQVGGLDVLLGDVIRLHAHPQRQGSVIPATNDSVRKKHIQ